MKVQPIPRPASLESHLLDSPEAIAAFAPVWSDFLERRAAAHSLFQSPAWLLPLLWIPEPRKLLLVLVEDAQGLAMIAPFSRVNRAGVRVLEWLGEPLLAFGDLLLRPGFDPVAGMEAALAFLQRVGEGVDVLHCRAVPADAAMARFFAARGAAPLTYGWAPYAALDEFASFPAYLATRNSRSLKGYRRKRRRLEERGALRFEVQQAGPQAQALGRQTLALKLEWMKAQGRISRSFAKPERLDALVELLGQPDSGAVVSGLLLNDRPLALEIGYRQGARYYSHIGAIDLAFADHSPGHLQLLETLRWCFEQGVERFDFLPPDSPYKRSWATDVETVSDYCLGLTPLGRCYGAVYLRSLHPLLLRAHANAPGLLRSLGHRWANGKATAPGPE
ncbi:GNAT family N-acetyltransferase [Aquibaculum sediminis]|uniref:GNAT family N-acetyltransferase n=1 Tax=Aquibaculum sediminis TaxID=3231907 RepID=UPI003454388A